MSPSFLSENFPTFRKIPRAPGIIGRGFLRAAKWTVRKTWKPILVIVIVLAVLHSIASVILGHRLKAEIAKIKATGAPVSMAELGKPKVPDADNAAVIYTEIAKDLNGLILNPNGGRTKNSSDRPEKDKDIDAIRKLNDATPGERSPVMWNAARKAVAKHRNILPLIEEAASRPKCQFPVNWEDGGNALLPHLSTVSLTTKFLCANALIQASDGKMEEAAKSIELGFKVSESLKDEPVLFSQLVRKEMIEITSRTLIEVLKSGDINETQARQIYDVLAQIDMYPGLDRAMMGERCFGLWAFDLAPKQTGTLLQFANNGYADISDQGSVYRLIWCVIGIAWRPILYADELNYLKLIDKGIELIRSPYREMHSQMATLRAELYNLPRYSFVSKFMFPIHIYDAINRDDTTAEVAACRIILALQVYKERYGAYPASLDELRTKIGWGIPKDVFSDKDFIYKRQGKGFLLYSVGCNMKDDGAIPSSAIPSQLPAGYYYVIGNKHFADIIWQMRN